MVATPVPARVSAAQIIAVAPLLGAGIVSLLVVVGWIAGWQPFWPVTDVTVSEAVLTKDSAEVVRLVEDAHADPDRPWPVRADVLGTATEMTPLQAAVTARRPEMVHLLLRVGARVPPGAERDALICLGVSNASEEIVELLLTTGDRSDPRGRCASGTSTH